MKTNTIYITDENKQEMHHWWQQTNDSSLMKTNKRCIT